MSRTRQPSSRRIGAAERAIALLDTLADAGELGTNEIARRTGMTPSTVSRQLGTLAASGLVERVAATGRYRLGLRIVQLANALLARLDVLLPSPERVREERLGSPPVGAEPMASEVT